MRNPSCPDCTNAGDGAACVKHSSPELRRAALQYALECMGACSGIPNPQGLPAAIDALKWFAIREAEMQRMAEMSGARIPTFDIGSGRSVALNALAACGIKAPTQEGT